jgi:hypothetical protein
MRFKASRQAHLLFFVFELPKLSFLWLSFCRDEKRPHAHDIKRKRIQRKAAKIELNVCPTLA